MARKSSYQAYSEHYDKFAAKHSGMAMDKYSEAEYQKIAMQAKHDGYTSNIARTVASQQRYFTGLNAMTPRIVSTAHFEKAYKNYYGKDASEVDFSDKDVRHDVFAQYIEDREAEGMTHYEAKRAAEDYFY